ncbi:iron ABC transporter permease [Ruficoccus amylovorans]|uniref:Iron ABC transporter permease n=1 Tax=Ruficoccus amylovorans TaxID=1804625 RepID=A0A842HID6_9BACT|nr:iron ABC transporter permease [Ruficoccus amylovorans]MBC2595758.1 iron ABC transporter permease [Ruficoccus amylovorans]
MNPARSHSIKTVLLVLIGLCTLAISLVSLNTGTVELTTSETTSVLAYRLGLSSEKPGILADTVVWDLRLPRIVLALAVGAGISLAGAAMQGLFRNPLADPGIIGVSSGAATGGVIAILFGGLFAASWPGFTQYALPICAMAGGVGTTFLIYRLSNIGGRTHIATMLLTGIAVNAISGALIGFVVTRFADDTQIRTITFWTLGSLAGANWHSALLVSGLTLLGAIWVLSQWRSLNAFLLGEAEAFQLGISVQRVKSGLIFVTAAMVGITVAACGIIGFVGLVVPHMIRLSLGPDHRWLLPGSVILGGAVMVLADLGARTLVAPAELQIGILTALIGGPFFLGLLLSAKRKLSI